MRYLFIFIFAIFSSTTAYAASLSVTAPEISSVGQKIEIDIVANTDGRAINSVEGDISYPSEMLEFSGYQDASGVVKLWMEPPRVKSDGVVHFVGGVPGGVDGTYSGSGKSSSLTIVRLIFTSKSSGGADVSIVDSVLLLNDGSATELAHTRGSAKIQISGGDSATIPVSEDVDTAPPLSFEIIVIPENEGGETPAMVSFSAYDQDSGIAEYKIKVGLFSRWKSAMSPYPLPKRLFPYTVRALAIDGAGNKQVASARVDGMLPGWVLIIFAIIISTGCVRYFMIKKKI